MVAGVLRAGVISIVETGRVATATSIAATGHLVTAVILASGVSVATSNVETVHAAIAIPIAVKGSLAKAAPTVAVVTSTAAGHARSVRLQRPLSPLK